MARVLLVKEFGGADFLPALRETLRRFRHWGVQVPRITAEGQWAFKEAELTLPEETDVGMPIGRKLLQIGSMPPLSPTAASVVKVYTIAEGELVKGNDPVEDLLSYYDGRPKPGRKTAKK